LNNPVKGIDILRTKVFPIRIYGNNQLQLDMPRRVAAFRHVHNEPLGYFEKIFADHGVPVEYINLSETNEIPRHIDATHLVFLGGPMSVNDEKEFPWLTREKELIRQAAKPGQKVLGICLGAQLIASAYGGKVFRFVKETGWHTVYREKEVPGIFSGFPETFPVFQLHGETFEIPYGGRLLASGENVHNQALICKNALGLQFHLEVTPEIIQDWSKSLTGFQRATIARDTPRFLDESNRLCRRVAEDFIR
jgi:GMP synthase-like glutamine amidotransferase